MSSDDMDESQLSDNGSSSSNIDDYNSDSNSEIESGDDDDVTLQPTWFNTTTGLRQIPFTGITGLKVPVPGNKPIDFFNLLVDSVFLENIVEETNHYAEKVFLDSSSIFDNSRITRWKPLTVDELRVFLGLVLHTGNIKLNRIEDYWKTHWLYNLPAFKAYMSRDRYQNILRCLHFSKEPVSEAQKNNRTHKIENIVQYFNTKMFTIYGPSKELSLDESLVLWRGRLSFRQYIKGKRHKFGIKLYTLSEPEGLVLNFHVYGGKHDITSGVGHVDKVVMYLMRHRLNLGHSIYMDNYYSSFKLASTLLRNDTYCTGTLRVNRKYTPSDVKDSKLKKGETIARYSKGVMIGAWKDQRKVVYLSSEFENNMCQVVDKRKRIKNKPLPIIQYNAHMKGIDRGDQLLAYHPCLRKSVRWYKKIFFHTLSVLINNAQFLYNMYGCGDRINSYDFRQAVLEELLPRPVNITRTPEQAVQIRRHALVMSGERDNRGRIKRKRCRVCHTKKVLKRTPYHCGTCVDNPGLCPECFDEYHNM